MDRSDRSCDRCKVKSSDGAKIQLRQSDDVLCTEYWNCLQNCEEYQESISSDNMVVSRVKMTYTVM